MVQRHPLPTPTTTTIPLLVIMVLVIMRMIVPSESFVTLTQRPSISTTFTIPPVSFTSKQQQPSRIRQHSSIFDRRQRITTSSLKATTTTTTTKESTDTTQTKFDSYLEDPSDDNLKSATQLLIEKADEIDLSRERFGKIFDAIEATTSAAEEEQLNSLPTISVGSSVGDNTLDAVVPSISKSRHQMTSMYRTLQNQGHLTLFGSIKMNETTPAAGSRKVRPSMLEHITSLSMKALTPKPSNTLLYAGVAVAAIEAITSVYLGLDLNVLFFLSVAFALTDRVFLNGALSETVVKILNPETNDKIRKHEAGHFLCSYLLGCPVEGYVLSAWAALQDPRFGPRGVSAGTSFFDADLSNQIASGEIKRSSIDRYSIIVMAGIAAEAVNYGGADGGAGDEMALIRFLSNLNGGQPTTNPVWNELTIRNQARWGALQAVLMLREYKDCYDALVDAFERGGSLGDCIYAIENTARTKGLGPLKEPLGYIVEGSDGHETWEKNLPAGISETGKIVEVSPTSTPQPTTAATTSTPDQPPMDNDTALEKIRDLKKKAQQRLVDLDSKLEDNKQ